METLKQIDVKVNKKFKALKDKEASLFKDLQKTLEVHIEIGELLEVAKRKCEDDGVDFKEHLNQVAPFGYIQSSRYMRIAKHKVTARLSIKGEDAITIDQLQKVLPKYLDDVVVVQGEMSGDVQVKAKEGVDKNDWHTPIAYIDAAREVMGGIDLDPFTSVQANDRVKAKNYYTEADDGLTTDWKKVKSVWMNPPYSKGLATKCVDKFLEERSKFKEGMVLMNSATDTQWFLKMRMAATSVCMTVGRISFEDAGGKTVTGNTKRQVFFYFGSNTDEFCKVFKKIGWVVPGGECHG